MSRETHLRNATAMLRCLAPADLIDCCGWLAAVLANRAENGGELSPEGESQRAVIAATATEVRREAALLRQHGDNVPEA